MVNIVKPVDANEALALLDGARQAVLEATEDLPDHRKWMEKYVIPIIGSISNAVAKLPVVYAFTEAEHCGYWLPGSGIKVKCSLCEAETFGGKSNFCPNCGATMKEKTDVLAQLQ